MPTAAILNGSLLQKTFLSMRETHINKKQNCRSSLWMDSEQCFSNPAPQLTFLFWPSPNTQFNLMWQIIYSLSLVLSTRQCIRCVSAVWAMRWWKTPWRSLSRHLPLGNIIIIDNYRVFDFIECCTVILATVGSFFIVTVTRHPPNFFSIATSKREKRQKEERVGGSE